MINVGSDCAGIIFSVDGQNMRMQLVAGQTAAKTTIEAANNGMKILHKAILESQLISGSVSYGDFCTRADQNFQPQPVNFGITKVAAATAGTTKILRKKKKKAKAKKAVRK